MKLGEKILELRKKNGLSQEQLGEKLEVTRQTISNWELGETSPNPEQLVFLSKIFNISIDDLLNNDVKNVIVEKVSNTEKLAGLAIKILKWVGIAFLVFLVIDVISLIVFLTIRSSSVQETTAKTICKIEEKEYEIEYGTSKYFNCDNCSSKMKKELEKLIDFNDIEESQNNIEDYFKKNNGTCE